MLRLISPQSPKSSESLQISVNSDTSTCYLFNIVQEKWFMITRPKDGRFDFYKN